MKPPRVVGASHPIIQEREPPAHERRAAHKWLPKKTKEMVDLDPKKVDLFVSTTAEEKIRNHAASGASERLEVMGFLLGNVYQHEGVTYSVVRDVATSDLEATSVRVKFQRGGMERLFASLDGCGFDFLLVGWYHSHPGHRCFLSSTDVDTQNSMFGEPYHAAMVIDPVNREIEAYRIEKGVPTVRPFAIYWDEEQKPYNADVPRRRRLKN